MWASVLECPLSREAERWDDLGMSQSGEDAVERQVRAYNAHDLDGFIASYAQTVVVEDADGRIVMNGREEMRERYGSLFATTPGLRADIVSRVRVGSYIVDEEHVTGRPDGDLPARRGWTDRPRPPSTLTQRRAAERSELRGPESERGGGACRGPVCGN